MTATALRFNVSLSAPTPRIERRPISVKLTKVAGSAAVAPRASDEITPVERSELNGGAAASCYLQIWELDKYKSTSYVGAETDRQRTSANLLVASIPGLVVRRATNLFEFQLAQGFARPRFDAALARQNGFLRLSLRDHADAARIINLHLSQHEGFLELGATIRVDPIDASFATLTDFVPFQLRNEIATIRRQVAERGGITVSLAGNWRTGKLKKNGNPIYTKPNDAEFERQSEATLDVLPSYVPDAERQARIGYHLLNQGADDRFSEVRGLIEDSRRAAGLALAQNELFLDAAAQGLEAESSQASQPALDQCPKLGTLLIFAHGTRRGLYHAWDGGATTRTTNTNDIRHWVAGVAANATSFLNVALYACSCGRGLFVTKPGKGKDPTNGRNFPGEETGFDSYAWSLFHQLKANGVADPSVWAHTTPAHATRNPYLRVFCSHGTGDIINFVGETPRVGDFTQFNKRFYKYSGDGWVQRGNLLREICTYHGAYLPWVVFQRDSIWHSTRPWAVTAVGLRALETLSQLQDESASAVTPEPDQVTFEGARREVITGAAGATAPVMITRLLQLDHFPGNATANFRVHVALTKGIQMTFDRVSDSAASPLAHVRELLDQGQTAVLEPVKANRFEALKKAAEKLRDDGFLTHASVVGGTRLVLSVSTGHVTIPGGA